MAHTLKTWQGRSVYRKKDLGDVQGREKQQTQVLEPEELDFEEERRGDSWEPLPFL